MRSTKMRFCMARFLLQTGLGLYVQRLKMTQKNRKAHAGDECKTAIGKKIKYFSVWSVCRKSKEDKNTAWTFSVYLYSYNSSKKGRRECS